MKAKKLRVQLVLQQFACLLIALILTACSSDTGVLVAPPKTYNLVGDSSLVQQVLPNNRVDILFVLDDSRSMADDYEKNLLPNIDQFVDAFASESVVDFHIAVVPIWDSRRYQTPGGDKCGVVPRTSSVKTDKKDYTGERNFWSLGEMLPLKAPIGMEGLLNANEPRYISRRDSYEEILRETLNVKPKEYVAGFCELKTDGSVDRETYKEGLGPEFEEMFSPIVHALSDPALIDTGGPNAGFRRSDAPLVVIIVSDADDGTADMTAENLDKFLRDYTGDQSRENFDIYGVLAVSTATGRACKQDPGGPPTKIQELLALSGQKAMSLCTENFGEQLAAIGQQVREKALQQIIELRGIPESWHSQPDLAEQPENWLRVTYGDPNDDREDVLVESWYLDDESLSIVIPGDLDIDYFDGAYFQYEYTALDPLNAKSAL